MRKPWAWTQAGAVGTMAREGERGGGLKNWAMIATGLMTLLLFEGRTRAEATEIAVVPATVVYDDVATEIAGARVEGRELWVTTEDLTRATRFELKPQGVCRDELCFPLPKERRGEFVREENGVRWFHLTEFARLVGQPFAVEAHLQDPGSKSEPGAPTQDPTSPTGSGQAQTEGGAPKKSEERSFASLRMTKVGEGEPKAEGNSRSLTPLENAGIRDDKRESGAEAKGQPQDPPSHTEDGAPKKHQLQDPGSKSGAGAPKKPEERSFASLRMTDGSGAGAVWYFGLRGDQREGLASLKAPNFTLPDMAGKMHSLADFAAGAGRHGKKVLLVTWASW